MKKVLLSLILLASCSQIRLVDNKQDKAENRSQKEATTTEVGKEVVDIKEEVLPDQEQAAAVDEIEVARKTVSYSYVKNTAKVEKYCEKIDKKFYKYGWGKSRCKSFNWHHVRNSHLGDPIMWVTYGKELKGAQRQDNITLVMCGVHGDEITPVKFCFDILHHLYQESHQPGWEERIKDNLIVVVPIVSPDSFFKKYPSRTNARGVDPNRNLPTKDWHKLAHKLWKQRYRNDKRRNPGKRPNSEPETVFQVNLIARYKPTKIISVHAPLTLLDYDGPTVASKHYHHVAKEANNLLVQMSKKAQGYTIKNYPFFPGSLGNYAGNERNIPTYTVELPTSDNRRSRDYWEMFRSSIDYALFHRNVKKNKIVLNDEKDEDNSKKN
jgi:protein MpaA